MAVYNGANLAKKGLVVVNVNYRVGSLGFMAHPDLTKEQGGASGNYGIQDQIAALQWVRDNIKAFGGDATKVTIAGQSAGAMSVQALLVSPLAKGLFRGAIIQSPAAPGTNGNYTPLETAEQSAVAALASAGVALNHGRARVAGGAGQQRRRTRRAGGRRPGHSAATPPVFASDVPVMTGYTLNDLFVSRAPVTAESWRAEVAGALWRSGRRVPEVLSGDTDDQAARSAQREAVDRGFNLKLVEWLGDARSVQTRVRVSLHSRRAGPGVGTLWRVPHLRGAVRIQHAAPLARTNFTDVDRRLADQLSSYVANFVKNGDPNGGTLPRWPAMTAENKAMMDLGDRIIVSRAIPLGADAVIAAGRAPAGRGRGGRGNPAPVAPAALAPRLGR